MNTDKKELIKRLSQYTLFADLPDKLNVSDGDLRLEIHKYIPPNSINERTPISDIIKAIENSGM